jgi:hypothetical protein
MATGDVTWFDQALVDISKKLINLSADTIKLGLITTSTTPAATTAVPCWGAGGTTNMSTNAVATGTSYTGPITLGTVSCTLSGGKMVFDAADVSVSQDASGFTNARWGIIYSDTATNKNCIAFVDLGSDRSIVSGPLSITWNASGILTIDQV